MLVKEVFTQLYKHSITKENPAWELECDCQNELTFNLVETLFQHELMELFYTYKASEKVIPIIHLHFDEIINWKQRSKLKEHKDVFSYLQFTWGICATTQLNLDGEFIYCFDVFMKSVFGRTFQNGEQYDLSDIDPYGFLNSKNNYIANSKEIVEQWFSQLYYYSKSFSGLNEWCVYFFEEVYYHLNEDFQIEQYHPQFLSNLLSWCEVNFDKRASRAIRNIIEREFNLITWSENENENEIKKSLGLQLLLCRDYRNTKKGELLAELEHNSEFNPLSKMQSREALCYDEESLTKNFSELIASIKDYNLFLETQNLDIFQCTYQRARIFKIFLSIFNIASDIEKTNIIEEILLNYYNVDKPQETGKTLFIIPNQYKRVAYCFPHKSVYDEKDSQKLIIEIIDAENKAFNTYRLLKGGIKQEIIITDFSVGMPLPKFAYDFEKRLLSLYDFNKIKEDLFNANSMSQFDLNSFPLQTLMMKTINKTLPINLSLSKKLDFPKIEKILFWSGFSQTSEIEREALEEIFQFAEIEFEVHNEENSSLKKFQNRIIEYKPDIVWISSHGEYQHYEPNISSIKLSESESISIRDFEQLINKDDKRRLLFLNVCEGGVHSQTGEFKNIGFPNLLTATNQDIISHLWMVEARFACVFGVFVALGVALLQKNYFEAFEYSLSRVLIDKETILEELETFPVNLTNLKERIQNNDSTEWDNIITTGSPVYNI
ncbi:hypothetical protein GGR22_000701 [Flavobacterium gossypii]|uniref:CHAT domain-containing protein n=1 Tax=Flavobacterium gossypii TaxID=1646119 RepID=A0ABR6DNX0_9FLAO|nr:CHAT domain-containing protein [Flavobacterium gossypii]MBA9072575.1 hypothetical protein [Flavobacterium gossypii]